MNTTNTNKFRITGGYFNKKKGKVVTNMLIKSDF